MALLFLCFLLPNTLALMFINGSVQPAVDYRIQQATIAMKKFHSVWKIGTLTVLHKLQLYHCCVTSVLLHGLESHVLTVAQLRSLEQFQNCNLRRLLKRPAHITRDTNQHVRELEHQHSIHTQLIYRRLRFFARILLHSTEHVATLSLLLGENVHTPKTYPSPWLKLLRSDIHLLALRNAHDPLPYHDLHTQILWLLTTNKSQHQHVL